MQFTFRGHTYKLFESVKPIDAARGKGLFRSLTRTSYKPENIEDCYDAYVNHDLIRGMVDDLSEAATGSGYYTTVEKKTPVFEKSKPKKIVDDFGEQFNLDLLLPNICKNILIAGFCPVDTKLGTGDVEKAALKIVHPMTVKDIETDPATGDVLWIKQKVKNDEVKIDGKDLAWFDYGKLGNDPRGTSYVASILTLLNILDNATTDMETIMNRYLSPTGIWKSRQSSETLKKAVEERSPGEDIFLGSLTPDEMKEQTVSFVQVDPRVPFWEFIESVQNRIYAYSRASNVYYTRNANLASAEVMEDIVARHVNAIQRGLKRSVERYWFTPLVTLNIGENAEVPKIVFGKQPTGVEDITPSDIITAGLNLGYFDRSQYFEILSQLGVKVTQKEEPEEPEAPEVSATVNPETDEPGETGKQQKTSIEVNKK